MTHEKIKVSVAAASGPYAKLYQANGQFVVETPEGFHRFTDERLATAMYVALCAAWSAGFEADPERAKREQDLEDALRGLLQNAVILSREYLASFEHLPLDATIQGWDKARWLRAIHCDEQARALLSKPTRTEPWICTKCGQLNSAGYSDCGRCTS